MFWLSVLLKGVTSLLYVCVCVSAVVTANGPFFHTLCLPEKEKWDTGTGCHCAVKPPGSAGKRGQDQQLTHRELTKNGTQLFQGRSRGAWFSADILFTCRPTSAATVCPSTHTVCAALLLSVYSVWYSAFKARRCSYCASSDSIWQVRPPRVG